MKKPESRVMKEEGSEYLMFALLPTSPFFTTIVLPPSSSMSFTSKVAPIFFGGRSVMTAYDFSNDSPATAPTETLKPPIPNIRANDTPKLGLPTAT